LSGVSAGKKASMKNAENSQNFNFEAVMTFCENLQKHFGIIWRLGLDYVFAV